METQLPKSLVGVPRRYLSEGGALHSGQRVQHPAAQGVFPGVPEQMLLSQARRPAVFSTGVKGKTMRKNPLLSPLTPYRPGLTGGQVVTSLCSTFNRTT